MRIQRNRFPSKAVRNCGLLIITLSVMAAVWVGSDLKRNRNIELFPTDPKVKISNHCNDVLDYLELGLPVDFSMLDDNYSFIEQRYGSADFRFPSLLRIIFDHREKIPPQEFERMKQVILGFKYWMDQPGNDGMCYWTENHQVLYASAEYLAGQLWPSEDFTNDHKTGAEHMEMAKPRILAWLEQRWLYGFSEWYSSTYYVEDIAPLANLIDFAEDEEIVTKATIVMDLLLYDLATQSFKGIFTSTSGRMYDKGKREPMRNSMRTVSTNIWGEETWGYTLTEHRGMDINFFYRNQYVVPEVIKAIGLDEGHSVVKASIGLNLDELESEGLLGLNDNQIMMQWAMEAFTNPEVISNTVAYIDRHDMFTNEFLHEMKMINFGILKKFGLLPVVNRVLKPASDGAALQRANTYTYRTPDYMIATSQKHHPGNYGNQESIWNALISVDLSLFTTHPALPRTHKNALTSTPGYWVGNGRMPHCVQEENIVLSLYQLPDEKGFLERAITDFTHAHFPTSLMDESLIEGNYAFGRKGNTYFAFIGRNPLSLQEDADDDLIQHGKDTYWIFEAGASTEEGSFADFIKRIKSNPVHYADRTLEYGSNGKSLKVEYEEDFSINGQVQDTEYSRFDSPYAKVNRKPDTIEIRLGEHSLLLDFYGMKRVLN